MPEMLKLIDIPADTPIEKALVGMLFKHKIPFDAQPHRMLAIVSYSVKNAEDLPKAKELLYRVLHPKAMWEEE